LVSLFLFIIFWFASGNRKRSQLFQKRINDFMLNRIISFSIQNKLIVGLFLLALIGYGSYQFTKLPIDAVPDITDNQVQVITVAPSLGAPDIERLITFPIEQTNSNIPGLKEIRSFSRFGLSLITIVFEDDVDVYWARQQVSERLKQAQEQIPQGIGSPVLAPVTTGLGEIYQYVVRAKTGYEDKYNATELRTIQDWYVRRQLLSVKGVADVSSFGGRVKQYEVAVNPAVLKANNLSISDIFNALEKNNENTGGAYIEKASTVLYIRSEGLIESLDDISQIVVKNLSNGTPVLIKDVAEVRIGNATRYGAITYNDVGEVAGAVVMMLKGENSSQVIEDVKARIEKISLNLPEGVMIEPFLDRTKMVNNAIGTVSTNLLEGALIVIFVLVFFLGNFRAGILVASVIPLSMLFAIILMNLFGVSGNLMSLGALDFGLIVDGAVIIVEAVMHHLVHSGRLKNVQKFRQNEMDETVSHSAGRMMNSAVFGQIIILVVYLPIFTLEGIEGKMFKPMAQTVAFALLGAFILSLTYIPMMSALFLSKKVPTSDSISDRIMNVVIRGHQSLLSKVLKFPKLVIGIVVSLFAIAVIILSNMGGEFIPELPEGDLAVDTRVLTGSNINTSTTALLQSSHLLLEKFPEIEKIVGKSGSGEIPTDPMPMEASDMMIILKDKSEWTSAKSWDELTQKMSEELKAIPGVTYSFQFPVAMRFNELMTGSKQDVVCKIFGENLDTLSKYSVLLGDLVTDVEGAQDVYVEPVNGLPQLIIDYDRKAIAQYGITISDVNRIVNMAFAGQSSGLVFEDEKRFDLVVRLAGVSREQPDDVRNLLIPTSMGTQIPLSAIADVSIRESVNQIQREDAKRRIIVGFNIHGRDVQAVVHDLQKRVNDNLVLPTGYYVTYGGAFENLEAAKERLAIAVPVSLLLIFLLLFFAFKSVKQGLLIYSAIPLSAIGGIFFLALRGMPFSISAGVGFIALFGVAVLNGIVLLAEFNRIKSEGETDSRRIVLLGTRHRLRPVLMTAFVASLGFLPMALSTGNGSEVQRPLATVVIGGLLIATFLTLFVLPVLYLIFDGKKSIPKKRATLVTSGALIIGILSNVNLACAQSAISLDESIDIALTNNLSVKNERLYAEYQLSLKSAVYDLPKTTFSGEYGQINSSYRDSKFGVSQSFSLPTVYSTQKSLQQANYDLSLRGIEVREMELRRQVSITYCQLILLQQKQQILLRTDSIYDEFLRKEDLRFQLGEANVLQKITAETQRGQIAMQLSRLQFDLKTLQIRFQFLLNSESEFLPVDENVLFLNSSIRDSSFIFSLPSTKFLQQKKQIATLNTKSLQAKMYPDLFVAYSNMSIQGTGADNIFYSPSSRFSSVQFGIGLPLFYGSFRSKIRSAQVIEIMSESEYQMGLQKAREEYESAWIHYTLLLETVSDFEKIYVPNSQLMQSTADQQFANGEIDFLEWAMLINKIAEVQSSYYEVRNELNEAIIQLNFLTTEL
jgi:cobalt-zinc-cadmium resistance protein CzcA